MMLRDLEHNKSRYLLFMCKHIHKHTPLHFAAAERWERTRGVQSTWSWALCSICWSELTSDSRAVGDFIWDFGHTYGGLRWWANKPKWLNPLINPHLQLGGKALNAIIAVINFVPYFASSVMGSAEILDEAPERISLYLCPARTAPN